MTGSLIYRSALLYELLIVALYGRHYAARYRAVAGLIPDGSSVLELCCGPGTLYRRHLRVKEVQYTGLDLNPGFVAGLVRLGIDARTCDLRGDEPWPEADYVVMQGSLYHFLPDPSPLLDRMLRAARRDVIVAESVRNLADSRWPPLRALARRHTDAGSGRQDRRLDESALDAALAPYLPRVRRSFRIPGGRDKVYVLSRA